MKKALNREICITAAQYLSTPILLYPVRRSVTPMISKQNQLSLPKFIRDSASGASISQKSGRYSLLSVPRTPTRVLQSNNTSLTPQSKLNISDLDSVAATIDTSRNFSKIEEIPRINIAKKMGRLRSSCRFRKNPNQENLRVALSEIEKKPVKVLPCEKVLENVIEKYEAKSDIELILESQMVPAAKSKIIRKIVQDLDVSKISMDCTKEIIEDPLENTNRSDPSPVRKKTKKVEFKRSQTPRKKNKNQILPRASSKLRLFAKSKVGKEFMEKYQNEKEVLEFVSDSGTPTVEHSIKALYDYRQESLKILKNTSSFANKLMKGIRCPGRIKKCYNN